MKLSPSVLASDLADLRQTLAAMEQAGVDFVHFDIMDGHFVPNLTFGPPLVRAARRHSSLPFDVHLMVTDPAAYIDRLAGLSIEILSFQIETTHFAPRLIQQIREAGMGPAVALNPQTPVQQIQGILSMVETVLVMSVDPGFAGQSFIPSVFDKIHLLHTLRQERQLQFKIEVDGGVDETNLAQLSARGVDLVVAGKAFFTHANPSAFTELVHRH